MLFPVLEEWTLGTGIMERLPSASVRSYVGGNRKDAKAMGGLYNNQRDD